MVNLSALNNLTPFSFNETILNNSDNITSELINLSNESSQGYMGLVIMITVYLFLLYTLMNEQGLFRLDFVKSSVFASGIVSILGTILIVSTLITSYTHVVWFYVIFIISLVSSYFLKEKGF